MTITIAAGERAELAQATGTVMRVSYRVVSGGGRIVGAALYYGAAEARGPMSARRARKVELYEQIRERLQGAVGSGQLTVQQALTLRDQIRDGDLSGLPDRVRERIEQALRRPLPEVQVDANATRAIIRAPGAVRSRGLVPVLVCEAVAGPGGAVIDSITVEAQ